LDQYNPLSYLVFVAESGVPCPRWRGHFGNTRNELFPT
jgi:hypothetical protein